MSVRAVRAIAGAVDLPLGWDIGWRRQEIDRLLDADHADMAVRLVRRLESWGWLVRGEVSFNRYGDRGRIDVLAFHPAARALLVVELKTLIVDAQELLGGLDVKTRVGPFVGRELTWRSRGTVPALVIAGGTTNRRRIAQLEPMLRRFSLRGHAAVGWLRNPIGTPTGLLLVVTKSPDSARSDARRAGRRRVRVVRHGPRSGDRPGSRQRPRKHA